MFLFLGMYGSYAYLCVKGDFHIDDPAAPIISSVSFYLAHCFSFHLQC